MKQILALLKYIFSIICNYAFTISVLVACVLIVLSVIGFINLQDVIGMSIGAIVLTMFIIIAFLGKYRRNINIAFPKSHIIVKSLMIVLFLGLIGFLGFLLSKI